MLLKICYKAAVSSALAGSAAVAVESSGGGECDGVIWVEVVVDCFLK